MSQSQGECEAGFHGELRRQLACEAAGAQLEQTSLIQADGILQQEDKKDPRSTVSLSTSLNVLLFVYLFHSECVKTQRRKRGLLNRNLVRQAL